jgi:hypothetical protein
VTGDVNPAVLEDLVRLYVELAGYGPGHRGHHPDPGGEPGSGGDESGSGGGQAGPGGGAPVVGENGTSQTSPAL